MLSPLWFVQNLRQHQKCATSLQIDSVCLVSIVCFCIQISLLRLYNNVQTEDFLFIGTATLPISGINKRYQLIYQTSSIINRQDCQSAHMRVQSIEIPAVVKHGERGFRKIQNDGAILREVSSDPHKYVQQSLQFQPVLNF